MIQLTDGTVMVQQIKTRNWWRLTPDSSGSYVDGTWSKLGALPSGYAPEYYASAVLPDGRVIIEGGEDNYATTGDTPTNKGAIYNPTTNKWVSVKPPSGWTSIGDAQSVVLANGQFMLAQASQEIGGKYGCAGSNAALLNATSLKWTATGAGKNSDDGCPYDEQGWTLLPDGQVLTVDTWRTTPTEATEVYTRSTGSWTSAGNTPAPLADSNFEMGPAALRPNGTVLAEGATGNNAIYNTTKRTWSAGPRFPGGFLTADAPSAVLPNGDVLAAASAAYLKPPEHFYLFNGTSYKLLADPPSASKTPTYETYMLDLPTGQVLVRIGSALEVYTGTGVPSSKWLPTITSVPTTLAAGSTYTVSGLQLNGLTQGAAYGDDFQDATNFPLVRLTNNATGQVSYARSTKMSSMSVAPKNSSSANFTLPSGIATGPSTLVVVANGIASAPVAVNLVVGNNVRARQIASDLDASYCAVLTTGGVDCWGLNDAGELGDGNTTNSDVPVAVSGLTDAVSVSSGGLESYCAVLTTGGVDCWGYNGQGQLGDGSTTNSDVPVAVSGLTNAASVVSGGGNTGTVFCARLTTGGVDCWGFGPNGGDVPVAVSGLTDAASISSDGDYSFCAVLTTGGVDCWGHNNLGELGDGSTTDSYVPVGVRGLTDAASVSSDGYYSYCAVLTTGGVDCWGNNADGKLGDGNTTDSDVPQAVSGLTDAVSVASDFPASYCAVLTTGGVDCWGDNEYGELGDGNTTNSDVPVAVSGLTDASTLSNYGDFSYCAVLTTGGLDCWGEDNYGQLGDGNTTNSDVPVAASGLTDVSTLSSYGDYGGSSCAVLTTGGVDCWGLNSYGDLGDGSTMDSDVPVSIVLVS